VHERGAAAHAPGRRLHIVEDATVRQLAAERLQVRLIALRAHERAHLVAGGTQLLRDMAADETGAAGQKDAQSIFQRFRVRLTFAPMRCPRCGTESSGPFCSNCGVRLQAAACARCGGTLLPGARYCNQCGKRAGSARPMRYALPIAIGLAGILVGAIIFGRAFRTTGTTVVPASSAAATRGAPPPLTGSMREQADRLFERIMQARARGDTVDARFFLPMALQAYENAGELDADGLFHLGLLQLEAGRPADARATADRLLAGDATHLLGFALRGDAALAVGDQTAARDAFTSFLSSFDREVARGLSEYEQHRPALDDYRAQAEQIARN